MRGNNFEICFAEFIVIHSNLFREISTNFHEPIFISLQLQILSVEIINFFHCKRNPSMEYKFYDIEKKWQKYWEVHQTFKVENDSSKPKYYVLDMFPYPSGAGLHVGHPLGYIASDIYSRYKGLKGFNVLHPMGFDAFGLPAEQYAVETGQHPAITTEKNITRYKEQLQNIGFCYDWNREVRTSDSAYYRWTQWIFLKLFNAWYNKQSNKAEPIETLVSKLEAGQWKGEDGKSIEWNKLPDKEKSDFLLNYRLAYLAWSDVNWCPALGTVLANDEVKDGKSERGGHPVIRKKMRQWFLRITAYADRLLYGLDDLDWPMPLKEMQRNWIGRSEGALIKFQLARLNENDRHGSTGLENAKFVNHLYETYGAIPQRLSPAEEQGRLEGGSFHVEATIVAERGNSANAQANSPEEQAAKIIKLAKELEVFIENTRELFGPPHAPETVESDAYYVADGTVTKVNHAVYYDSPLDFLDSYAVWNFLFPETRCVLSAVTLHDGKIAFVLKQPFIKAERSATLEEISDVLENLGFEKNGTRHKGFYHPELDIWLRDLNEGNVFVDVLGNVQFIDAYIDIKGRTSKADIRNTKYPEKDFIEVFTTRPDTIFGATFMVIAPEHELVAKITTPVQKLKIQKYLGYVQSRSEVERQQEKSVTGEFTGAYAINPFTNKKIPVWIAEYVLAGYGTGAIMAVPSDDDRDHAFATKFGLEIIDVIDKSKYPGSTRDDKEGIMINSGFITGMEVPVAINTIIEKAEQRSVGRRKVNYKMHDAGFSRQRYWGEPFPIVYKKTMPDSPSPSERGPGGEVLSLSKDEVPTPLPESDLPVILPEVSSYQPTGDGESPLASNEQWKKMPDFSLRETDTMPGYAGSSWYFLRYMDPHNKNEFVSKQAEQYWQNVDLYIGGSEHAVGHLLYARLWHKVLFDLGYVSTQEPFKKLINQGMIQGRSNIVYRVTGKNTFVSQGLRAKYDTTALHVDVNIVENDVLDIEKFRLWREEYREAEFILEDGKYYCGYEIEKMSKRWHNVVNPDDVVAKYGADCFRMYEMFLGPIEQHKPWDTQGIEGVFRFLKKFWKLFHDEHFNFLVSEEIAGKEELKVLHKTIKKIQDDTERFSFNTAVSNFMICTNELTELKCNKREILEPLVILIAPYAPHMSEELWSLLGKKQSVSKAGFPVWEESFLAEDVFTYPVSFNGKMRYKIDLPAGMAASDIEKAALSHELATKWLEGKTPKKVIVVPKKIVNVVI